MVAKKRVKRLIDRHYVRHRDQESTGDPTVPRVDVRRRAYAAPLVPRIDQDTRGELVEAEDADELCRLLLGNPSGWGRSTRHAEAVELLARVHATGELPFSLAVLLVCTCRRWDRVTARLIAGIHDGGLLNQAELDELADAFLAHDHVISYPLAWASPQWLEIDLHDGTGRIYTVTEDTPAEHHVRPEPPLRRWAACQALRGDPARLTELLSTAERFEPRDRDAAINGLLDAADVLDEPEKRTLIDRGLRAAHGSVRIAALELLCELHGAEPARRFAAADPNAQVRKWRPPEHTLTPALFAT
ncbi:MAG: hypothetical protein ACRDLT_13250 [Solirubrobacteraceae bacterium]